MKKQSNYSIFIQSFNSYSARENTFLKLIWRPVALFMILSIGNISCNDERDFSLSPVEENSAIVGINSDTISSSVRMKSATYEDIINIEMVGFAKHFNTTGGKGKQLITVQNLNNSGTGSLRAALSSGGRWIRFAPGLTGVIVLNSPLEIIGDNVTIDGRGADITLRPSTVGVACLITKKQNIAIMYLKFENWYESAAKNDAQAIVIEGGSATRTRYWIHRCTFTIGDYIKADDCIAIGVPNNSLICPTGITISRCYFFNMPEAVLLGWGEWDNGAKMTMHRNKFEQCGYRTPMVRGGYVHSYNNIIRTIQGVNASSAEDGNKHLAHNNIYHANSAKEVLVCRRTGSAFKAVNCWKEGAVLVTEVSPTTVGNPPYSYTLITDKATLESKNFGWVNE